MIRVRFFGALCLGVALLAPAQGLAKGGGGGHHSSGGGTARPSYGGGHHTGSHGGTYKGGTGSAHKGGEYKNPKTADQYGTHK